MEQHRKHTISRRAVTFWLASATFLSGLLFAAAHPFGLSISVRSYLVVLGLILSSSFRQKSLVLAFSFLATAFVGGHQWGSFRFMQHVRQLPPAHEIGETFKIKARVLRQWPSQRGLTLSLDRIEILSPKEIHFQIPRIIAYLPEDIRQVRRNSQIQTWITLNQKTSSRPIPWPMLDMWETYRPSYYAAIKSRALIEDLETTAPPSPNQSLSPGNQQLLALFLGGKRSQIWHERLHPLGLGHLLAISGLHCLVVFLLIQALLFPLRNPVWRTCLTVIGLCFFAQHMGWSPSVSRATFMLLVWQILPLFNRKRDSLKIWASLLLVSAIYEPTILFSQGYWYTFAASLGLLVAAKPLRRSPLIHPLRFRVKPILPLVGAQLMVLPVQLVFGVHAPVGSIFWNLFGAFFLALLLILFCLCLIATFFTFLAPLVNGAEFLVGSGLERMVSILPEAAIVRFPHSLLLGFLAVSTMAFLLRFAGREWRWYAACSMLFSFCLINRPLSGSRTMMLDVGQGMSFLHVDEQARAWLFDAGGSLPPRLDFKRVIRLYGCKSIGGAFVSHLNWDHYQLLESLTSAFPIYLPAVQSHMFRQQHLLRNNHTHLSLQRGQTLVAGDLKIQVLGPQADLRAPNTNESSLILLIDGPWGSLLFMGDAGTWAESRLQWPKRPNPRWLQVGHHGSKTATGDLFLKRFRPQGAFISAGRNNPFGHPHASVVNRLIKNQVQIFDTSKIGTFDFSNLPVQNAATTDHGIGKSTD